jgi:hypothetical protein
MDIIRRVIPNIARRPDIWWATVALLVYTSTTIAITYLTLFRLNSMIIGVEDGDVYRYAWTLWWTKETALRPDLELAHCRP